MMFNLEDVLVGKKLGALWEENKLPKMALGLIPPDKWRECYEFLKEYPRADSLLTKWGESNSWERWILTVLSIKAGVQIDPRVPKISGMPW
jgi:hypothetical protein